MSLHVRTTGPEGAPSVVFLHGGGVAGWSWEEVAERLPNYHCLIPDLPEHGESRGDHFSIATAAREIAGLIAGSAHGGRAHLVGLSLGGQVALELMATSPEMVDRALLCGTLACPLPGRSLMAFLLRIYSPFRNIDALVRLNQRYYGIPERYLPQVREDTRRAEPDSMARIFTANMTYRLPPALKQVEVPTLVLVGQGEYGLMKRSAMEIVCTLPKAQGRLVARMPHNWPLQDPDLCAEIVKGWIEDREFPDRLIPLR